MWQGLLQTDEFDSAAFLEDLYSCWNGLEELIQLREAVVGKSGKKKLGCHKTPEMGIKIRLGHYPVAAAITVLEIKNKCSHQIKKIRTKLDLK